MATAGSTNAIEKAKKLGVIEHGKKIAAAAAKKTAEATTRALATTKAALKRANEAPNVPQLATMAVAGTVMAPIGAAMQRGLANMTANMTNAIMDPVSGTPTGEYQASFARKAIVHGGIPLVGLVIAGLSAKFAKSKGMVAAGGIGIGIGLLIGSLVRSWQVPLQNAAPVEG